jgi:predicted acyltransferase
MPFSRRAERPRAALLRTARLALLGLAVVTVKYGPGTLTTGVLGHIAGAYLLCWLLLRLPRRAQTPVAVGVLAGVSLLSLLVPVPGVGRPALEPGASWAAWADGLVGVHLSAESPHAYLTSAATVYLGVLAGRVLRTSPGRAAVRRLALGAVPVLAAGLLLATVLPVNKRLWTPSYVLVTGGIGLLLLAAVHWAVDVRGFRRPLRPLEVLGINAIVAFVTSEVVFRAVLGHGVQRAAVAALERAAGGPVAAWAWALLAVVTAWAVCAQLARRGVVVRV